MTSDADVLEVINMDTYPDGTSVILDAVFGSMPEYNSTTRGVTSARAMMQVSLLLHRMKIQITTSHGETFMS